MTFSNSSSRVDLMTNTHIERLLDVAKRLDEMADDGPDELTTLSEEIGVIAAALEDRPRPSRTEALPRWMQDIQNIVERNAEEITYRSRGKHPYRSEQDMEAEMRARRWYMPTTTNNPKDFLKGITV